MTFQTRQEIARTRDANMRQARAAQLRTEIQELEAEIARKRVQLFRMEPTWEAFDDAIAAKKKVSANRKAAIDPNAGVCGKCHKHIGRGVKWHEKACKGAVQ